MTRKKRLYVGCGLTNAPEEFIRCVIQLREDLRRDFEILDFWTPIILGGEKNPAKIVQFDIEQLKASEVMLGICDHPSFGLGFETAHALWGSKKTLLVAHRDALISAFPLGLANPFYRFEFYDVFSDIANLTRKHLR